MPPSEETCKDCPFFTVTSGAYGGPAAYPGCTHPLSGPRSVNHLDEMSKCPKD